MYSFLQQNTIGILFHELSRLFDAVSYFRKETDSAIDSETSHTEQSFIIALGRNRTCDLRIRSPRETVHPDLTNYEKPCFVPIKITHFRM